MICLSNGAISAKQEMDDFNYPTKINILTMYGNFVLKTLNSEHSIHIVAILGVGSYKN